MELEDIRKPGTLPYYLCHRASSSGQDAYFFGIDLITEFPQWCTENPDDATRFKRLIAESIVGQTMTWEIFSNAVGISGDGMGSARVDEVMRGTWFDLWGLEPIPSDRHPLPHWWFTWRSSGLLSEIATKYHDWSELSPAEQEWFAKRNLPWDPSALGRDLLFMLVKEFHSFGPYNGYLRMMRARWESGDKSAEPTLPPDPADIARAMDWIDWLPTD